MKTASAKSVSWKTITFLVSLIALSAIGFSIKTSLELKKAQDPSYQQILVQKETEKLLDEVSKLYLLPEGNPQIAIVSDPETLKK